MLLGSELLQVHTVRSCLSHWHLIAHRRISLIVWLLQIDVDVNARIDHRLTLICLINYIWILISSHHLLLWHQIVVSESLLNLRRSCLEWHWLKAFLIFNERLIKSLEWINSFLLQ